MSSRSIDLGEFGVTRERPEGSILTVRPGMSIIIVSASAPALLLAAGLISYLLPLNIDRDLQLVASILLTTLGVAGLGGLLVLYEALARAVYTVTTEHIEEQHGIVYKRLRRIPLSYIRDVTQTQNFLQAMFGVSSITVSPTNGDKIVLSNVKDADTTREAI
jgi:membrane protein YdbS with pleckstrin-like domain